MAFRSYRRYKIGSEGQVKLPKAKNLQRIFQKRISRFVILELQNRNKTRIMNFHRIFAKIDRFLRGHHFWSGAKSEKLSTEAEFENSFKNVILSMLIHHFSGFDRCLQNRTHFSIACEWLQKIFWKDGFIR